mmetsp:Transcript_74377/g.210073  ORF Transcript_74377/g.210073 Transcript_74377/m.210073 type:complete len:224 (+) Transcript_74377:346-1017(+)
MCFVEYGVTCESCDCAVAYEFGAIAGYIGDAIAPSCANGPYPVCCIGMAACEGPGEIVVAVVGYRWAPGSMCTGRYGNDAGMPGGAWPAPVAAGARGSACGCFAFACAGCGRCAPRRGCADLASSSPQPQQPPCLPLRSVLGPAAGARTTSKMRGARVALWELMAFCSWLLKSAFDPTGRLLTWRMRSPFLQPNCWACGFSTACTVMFLIRRPRESFSRRCGT